MAENGAFRGRKHGGGGRRSKPTFGLLLALVALAFQCFIVQPHVDGIASAAPSFETIVAAAQATPLNAANDQSAPCLICRELATAGAFLGAAPPALALLEHTIALRIAPPRAPAAPIVSAHSWQSRAPPLFS